MYEQELIAAVKAAKTKDELEILVKQELGIDLDKRRKLEDLRGDILAGLGAVLENVHQEPNSSEDSQLNGQTNQATGQEQEGAVLTEPQTPVTVVAEAPMVGQPEPTNSLLDEAELPELEEEGGEWELEETAPANRLLRNRENGREFIWTPELAKLSHMEEV
ncbi:hypothetical protein WG219_10015 [Ectopseudomonas mendocina]|uniref:Uncharacterized protein n=1 Tax=Ectopseudomonas mendocina TaxID=300 RepID=A0ABZ2RSS5_ECTME